MLSSLLLFLWIEQGGPMTSLRNPAGQLQIRPCMQHVLQNYLWTLISRCFHCLICSLRARAAWRSSILIFMKTALTSDWPWETLLSRGCVAPPRLLLPRARRAPTPLQRGWGGLSVRYLHSRAEVRPLPCKADVTLALEQIAVARNWRERDLSASYGRYNTLFHSLAAARDSEVFMGFLSSREQGRGWR